MVIPLGASSFSLSEVRSGAGNVLDRSHISNNFLILIWQRKKDMSSDEGEEMRGSTTTKQTPPPDRTSTCPCLFCDGHCTMDSVYAYLLILGRSGDNIVHEHGKQFSHSSHTRGKSAIRSCATRLLSCLLGLVYPLPCY
jgi:hypothetical protein